MGAPKCTRVAVSHYCYNMRQKECIFVCLDRLSLPLGELEHYFLVVIGKAVANSGPKGMSEGLDTLL